MKKVILMLFICCNLITSTIAQIDTSKAVLLMDSKEYNSLIKKSKIQKTVGWVIVGGSIGVLTIGGIISRKNNKPYDPNNPLSNSLSSLADISDAAILTAIAGGVTLCSIPLFVTSSRNMKKAKLMLKEQDVKLLPAIKDKRTFYQVGITIDL